MSSGDSFSPGDALHNLQILYVDGDSHRRDLMRRLLLSMGAAWVQMAENGPEALKVVLGSTCGLVITEHKMEPMSGTDLVREIRAVANYPRALVPTLILSDPAGPDVVKAALDAGTNHFIIRPISKAKLYERIQWVITDTRAFAVKDNHYVLRPGLLKTLGRPRSPSPAAAPG